MSARGTASESERARMLSALGMPDIEALISTRVPDSDRLAAEYALPAALPEADVASFLAALAERNLVVDQADDYLGAGCYNHYVPAVVRSVISDGSFSTAYTPYQPEVSQGTLTTAFEFQTMMSELTGCPVVNSSMYDGASSLAEAMFMAVRQTGRKQVMVCDGLHPEYLETLRTYALPHGISLDPSNATGTSGAALEPAAFILQSPDFFGRIHDIGAARERASGYGALLVVASDPISMALLQAPGSAGADIVAGDGGSLGLSRSFGGPSFGYLACSQALMRQMPGRICGRAGDASGRIGYVFTLQAREQHIRRERASSNICSNHQLAALGATVYMSALGADGMRDVAESSARAAAYLLQAIEARTPWRRAFKAPFFREFAIRLPGASAPDIARVTAVMRQNGILCGIPLARLGVSGLDDSLLVSVTEVHPRESLDRYVDSLAAATSACGYLPDGGER